MPKRKKTRQNQTRAKKPMLPEGDLNTSMTLDERKQKLDVYLRDFDLQVKERIKKMKARSHNLICKIKGAYTLEIMRLPMNIRKMTLKEYFAQGGEFGDDAMAEADKLVSEMTNSVFHSETSGMRTAFTDVSNTLLHTPAQVSGNKNAADSTTEAVVSSSTSSRSTRSKKRDASPSSALGSYTKTKLPKVLENAMMMPPTALPPSSSRRRSKKRNASPSSAIGSHTRSKLPKVQEDLTPAPLPPTSTRRSSRRNQSKAQFTPATRGNKQSCFDTPAITPKFDPRLPITPFLREPKPGERIMSLSGSPVVNHTEPKTGAHMYIPLGNGRTFHLNSEINFSPSQASALNDVARQNIEMLQKQLSKLLKMPAQPKAK